MKIVALYKGFEGTEFLDASIESIYNVCHKVVFINSDKSWSGQSGNTVHEYVESWKKECDKDDKILNILGTWTDQYEQYMHGIRLCQQNFEFDYFLIIDTDEVWDPANWERAMNVLNSEGNNYDAFSTKMFTYVKNPFYRVEPVEPCAPTAFVKANISDFAGIRGSAIPKKGHMDNVYFHHFCYVRLDDETIRRKFTNSHIGDKQEHEHRDRWMASVWKRIPSVRNFHPTKNCESCWGHVRVIEANELPPSVQCKEILSRFPK